MASIFSIPCLRYLLILLAISGLLFLVMRQDFSPKDSIIAYFSQRAYPVNTQEISTSSGNICKIPQLLIDDPLVQPFLSKYDPLKCTNETNWVYTIGDGRFYISHVAVGRHGHINCTYYQIDRKSDYSYAEIDHGLFANGTELIGDSFRAICHSEDNSTYDLHHAAVPNPNEEIRKRIESARYRLSNRSLDLNVMIYLMDSISRVNFIRQCPKFYSLLTGEMGAYIMEGFNTVGDGTPWTIIPMTTGHFQTELPEARKRLDNASYVDNWPLIFKNYSQAGYVTSYVEEQPGSGAFNYKLKGFDKKPVDHYLRTLLWADGYFVSKTHPYCMGDTPRSIIWCKFWRELQIMYSPMGGRHFSFLFSSELSHDDYNTVQQLDQHWVDHFGQLYHQGFLNDTLLIVMGDHGRRFGSVRQTQSGKLEEKLPFLAIVLPQWFKEKFPKSHQNLLTNQHRLMTAFDLHATLMQVLNLDGDGGIGNVSDREISLFKEIPQDRTCAHAHIKPHFCTCLDWKEVINPDQDPIIVGAVHKVIDYFNNQTKEVAGRCAILNLDKLVWARLLKPKDQLMAFKESIDFDNYNQDLTGDKKLQAMTYQFRFITKPGGADFEASVSYFLDDKKYLMSSEDISRLNAYNSQAQCVINTHGHLRTFCYCVSK